MGFWDSDDPSLGMISQALLARGASSYDPGAGQRGFAEGIGRWKGALKEQRQDKIKQQAAKEAQRIMARRMELLEQANTRQQGVYDQGLTRDQNYQTALSGMFPPGPPTPYEPGPGESPDDLNVAGMPPTPGKPNPLAALYAAMGVDKGPAAMMKQMGDQSKSPTKVQEYQFAQKQGYQGTYQNWVEEAGRYKITSDIDQFGNRFPALVDTRASGGPQIVRGQNGQQPDTGNRRGPPSVGEKAVDTAYSKEYVAWTAQGGKSDAIKNVAQIKMIAKRLKTSTNLTGPVTGNVPDWMRGVLNPESLQARELVEEVVQRNLKAVLGPQFTEGEGTRLIKRAYNETLPEKYNAPRLGALAAAMEEAVKQKDAASQYWEKNRGTLRGYKSTSTMTMGDIEKIYDRKLAEAGIADAAPEGAKRIPEGAVPHSKTPDGKIWYRLPNGKYWTE
jgi:hypothetical protein